MQIGTNTVVAMRYTMKNSRGEVIEDTWDRDPVNYLHGASSILPLLQKQLEGLQAGDKRLVHLLAETGHTPEDFSFEVIIDNVREALPEEILLGYPVKMNISKCQENCACYK